MFVESKPLEGSDQERQQEKTGLRSALFSVNNAMFSLANARRQLKGETWQHIQAQAQVLVNGVEALRDTLAELHDEELADD